jgi:hypothetical protein
VPSKTEELSNQYFNPITKPDNELAHLLTKKAKAVSLHATEALGGEEV